ncbi:MAG: hypothetical protein RL722_1558 [Pseudomonadota bacterium]|jgi:alpha/beta superfamily hydrolase
MNAQTHHFELAGAAGAIACALDRPAQDGGGIAVLAHPHPLFGGTMDNKVVQTMVRAFLALGLQVLRFNFRGVGGSAGSHDEGRGETDDYLEVARHARSLVAADAPLVLGGFSFGAYVTTLAAARLAEAGTPARRLLLVGPSTQRATPAPVPADTVIIHGEADEVVPLSAVLDWARPQHLPVTVMPGVGHFFHGQLTPLRELIVRQWR